MAAPDQKMMRFMISTPEMEAIAARCERFHELLQKTLMDFIKNDGPLPLSFLQTAWQEATGHFLVTGLEEVLPKFVERPQRVSRGVHA